MVIKQVTVVVGLNSAVEKGTHLGLNSAVPFSAEAFRKHTPAKSREGAPYFGERGG